MKAALASTPTTDATAAADYRMLSSQVTQCHASVQSAREQGSQQLQVGLGDLKNYMNTCSSTLCLRVGQSFQAVGQQQLQQLPSPSTVGNPSPATAGIPSPATAGNSSAQAGGGDTLATYRPPLRLTSVSSFYREWYGEVGTITNDRGGFKSLEEKKTWRRHWSATEKKRWSRMKKLIQIVDRAVAQNPDKPKLHILMFYDQKWQELNGALTTFISAAEKSDNWQPADSSSIYC